MQIASLVVFQTFHQIVATARAGTESPSQVRSLMAHTRRDQHAFETFREAIQRECPTWSSMATEWARSEIAILAFDPAKFSLQITRCPLRDLWAHLLSLVYEQPDLLLSTSTKPSLTVKESMGDYLVSTIRMDLPSDYSTA